MWLPRDQMRCTLEIDRPEAFAITPGAPGGRRVSMVSSVAVAISVILSSPILRGAPGHGSSVRPSIRLGAPSGIQSVAAEAQLHRSARRRWRRQSAFLLITVEPKAARGDRVESQPAARVY